MLIANINISIKYYKILTVMHEEVFIDLARYVPIFIATSARKLFFLVFYIFRASKELGCPG